MESSTTRYEEWGSIRQRPYKHRAIKTGEDTISKTLVKLYIQCLSERRIPTAWKNAKMMIIFKNGIKKDLKNYRPIVQIIYYPIFITFIDYDKAFDSVQIPAVLTALQDIRCVYRTPQGNLHQQLDDSPHTERKQQDRHQERSTTGRYHIVQAFHGSNRKHIPTTDLGNQRLEDGRRIS